MSKPKFTQGPWRVDTSGRYVGNFEHGSCLTAHTDIGGCSFDEQKANAHLIAAAPDMAMYIKRKADEGDAEAQELWNKANGAA